MQLLCVRLAVNAKERNFPHRKRQRLLQEIATRFEASRKEYECGDHKDNHGAHSGIYYLPVLKGVVVTSESQRRLSAVTGMEKGYQPSTSIGPAERAERLRDYFDLQLRFAEAVAATAALPLADAVAYYTNFYRRFGLGRWHDAPIAPEWTTYTAHLLTLETHDQRVACTQAFFAQSPPERLPPRRQQFGCFGCDPPDADGRVRIHFTNHDADGIGPLSRIKIEQRTQELHAMFTYVQHTYPEAKAVRGGSWLYHLEAYCRLFPSVYGASRTVQEGTQHFQGTSSWGQFLDHHERVKPALREQFLANLTKLDMQRLWEAFPLPTYSTQAPIQAFYDFYHIMRS
jgi:hypothetical protein